MECLPEEDLRLITSRLFRAPERFGFASEDDAADALAKNWKKLGGVAKSMKSDPERGEASVDAGPYVDTCLRWLAKTERRNRKRREERETASSCGEVWEIREAMSEWGSVGGQETEFASARLCRNSVADIPARYFMSSLCVESRRIIFLYLKCAWEADDALTLRVARRTGVPFPWLANMAERARRHLEPERARIDRLNSSMNTVWLRIRVAEKRIAEDPDSRHRAELEARLARDRQRYEKLTVQRGAIRPIVPNSEVAKLLGVPKGTVDSGIYYLRASKSLQRQGTRG